MSVKRKSLQPEPERYISVSLADYLSVNKGKIKKDKEVVFSFYQSGYHHSQFGGMSCYTSCWSETVTRVRKHPKGYSGTTAKGKRIVVEENHASLHLPLSILIGQ